MYKVIFEDIVLFLVSEMLDVSVEELRSALVADYTVTRGLFNIHVFFYMNVNCAALIPCGLHVVLLTCCGYDTLY
jgi:hypothetical protein